MQRISIRPVIARNLACARLSVLAQFEYRTNFFIDAVLQGLLVAAIEGLLWWSVFRASGAEIVGGFGREDYLSYALWAAFCSRISTNWMYEFRMAREVELGTINSILTRPISFYEYYLSQFLGYKILCAMFGLAIPLALTLAGIIDSDLSVLPMASTLILCHLILAYTMSYCMAGLAFFTTRISAFTVVKNFTLWLLSGELFPLDLLPPAVGNITTKLPFAAGTYIPVALLTGRISQAQSVVSLISVGCGILFFALLGRLIWAKALRTYGGTGA